MSNNKKQKRCIGDDLICPITLELPVNPVMAEDGRVYERGYIETYFKGKPGEEVESPITKQKIGKRLFPAIQTKNHIETLVETGVIKGDLAEKWQSKIEEKKEMEDLLDRAKQGDKDAMSFVACSYYCGVRGFKKDGVEACRWFKKGACAGGETCAKAAGTMLVLGRGVSENTTEGLMYIGMAAAMGKGSATLKIAHCYASGLHGLPVDKDLAAHWARKALSDYTDTLREDEVQLAKDIVELASSSEARR